MSSEETGHLDRVLLEDGGGGASVGGGERLQEDGSSPLGSPTLNAEAEGFSVML